MLLASVSLILAVFCLLLLCHCQDGQYAPNKRNLVALVGGSCGILLGVLVEEMLRGVAGGDGNESENVRQAQSKKERSNFAVVALRVKL